MHETKGKVLHFLHERDLGREMPATLGTLKHKDREAPPHPRPSGFQNKFGSPCSRTLRQAQASLRTAQRGLLQKLLSHAQQQLRRTGRPLTLRAHTGPGSNGSPEEAAEPGGAASGGPGVRRAPRGARPPPPPLSLRVHVCPRRAPPARAAGTLAREGAEAGAPTPGGRTPGIVPDCACASEPGAQGVRPPATTTG